VGAGTPGAGGKAGKGALDLRPNLGVRALLAALLDKTVVRSDAQYFLAPVPPAARAAPPPFVLIGHAASFSPY
jgi:hypothetical protein